ncbi:MULTISPECIES: 3'-5' exonuclease [unclassified Corynebacterium]|uniref:3'-5' exonuclease n=1 Tax=unclassified Corynebacterium TaxID=2624378 RepID=UPI0030AE9CED
MSGFFGGFRKASAKRKATGPLAEFYATPTEKDKYLAVDVETTGLDPNKSRLLSIGWVPVDGPDIILGGTEHLIIRGAEGDASVGESATLHGLTDDAVAQGVAEEEAVAKLLEAMKGRTLLAHFAKMEVGFVDLVCKRHFGGGFHVEPADTMSREYLRIVEAGREPERDELRLWNLREKYGLPVYKAHHALTDALACAELWLAQDAAKLPRK